MQSPVFIFLALLVCTQFSSGYTKQDIAEDNNVKSVARAKRESYDMMRYGRGLHMLRLGKRDDYSPIYLVDDNDDDGYDAPAFERFRRSLSRADDLGLSSPHFQNKAELEQVLTDDFEDSQNDVPPMTVFQPLKEDNLSPEDLELLRLGKRQLPMLRLGRRSLGMLRLGKRDFDEQEEKRSLGMLRLGKRYYNDWEAKRGLSMLRLGKRQLPMLRLGKRSLGMLRLGKSLKDTDAEEGKRSLGMLRLGKRQLAMLRLGKRFGDQDEKRALAMLRLGKRFDNAYPEEEKTLLSQISPEKRPMNMLRLGKREEEDKRSLSMLRLGKRSTQ